jgi:hypothetical protein
MTVPFNVILAPQPATISFEISPAAADGSASANPGGTYKSGQVVTLTGKPATGYYFVKWQLPDGTQPVDNPHTYTLVAGQNIVIAVFAPTNTAPGQAANLETPVSPVGGGTVTMSVAAPYTSSEVVTLTAVPATGYIFSFWSITGSQITTNPYPYTLLAGDNTVEAVFVLGSKKSSNTLIIVGLAVGAVLLTGVIALAGKKR